MHNGDDDVGEDESADDGDGDGAVDDNDGSCNDVREQVFVVMTETRLGSRSECGDGDSGEDEGHDNRDVLGILAVITIAVRSATMMS